MLICFGGCGWMFPFHFGVAKYIQDHHVCEPCISAFAGVSGGAAVACTLACGIDVLDYFEEAMKKNRVGLFGMCDAVIEVCLTMFKKYKVKNIEKDKLFIQLSSAGGLKPELCSEFKDIEQCVDVIRASSHIPVVGGLLPYKVDGMGMYYDGGLVNLLPILPDTLKQKHRIIKVDALGYSSNCDIHIGFSVPYSWAFVPRKKHIMRLIFRYGYLKAKQFFEPFSEELIHSEIHSIEKVIKSPMILSKM